MKHRDVLIIGAGPTGLVLALWLTRLDVNPAAQSHCWAWGGR
jgi:2-polyprenyl-6-methoxyphenol hydroxylase-like FAD-dependent oxidoreductase